MNTKYEGLIPKLQRLYLSKELDSLQKHLRAAVERISTQRACAACDGAPAQRGRAAPRSVDGTNIAECSAMEVRELAAFVREIDAPARAAAGRVARPRGSSTSTGSGSATSASTARPRRSPAASRSA